MEKGCNVRETNGMEREKEQADETLSRDVLQASVILLFALLFFLCGGSYDRLRDGWGNTITINMFPLSICCQEEVSRTVVRCVVVHNRWVGGEPIPRQSLSRLSGLCFRLWIGRRYHSLARKRLVDLLSPLKISLSLSLLIVGIATVYGLRNHHACAYQDASLMFRKSPKVDRILRPH
jgi:hypothetical protein